MLPYSSILCAFGLRLVPPSPDSSIPRKLSRVDLLVVVKYSHDLTPLLSRAPSSGPTVKAIDLSMVLNSFMSIIALFLLCVYMHVMCVCVCVQRGHKLMMGEPGNPHVSGLQAYMIVPSFVCVLKCEFWGRKGWLRV